MADLGRRRSGFEAAAEGPTGGQRARSARHARRRAGAAPRTAARAPCGGPTWDGGGGVSRLGAGRWRGAVGCLVRWWCAACIALAR
eukprot:15451595-Alexandrium_andersonii.AAC.1